MNQNKHVGISVLAEQDGTFWILQGEIYRDYVEPQDLENYTLRDFKNSSISRVNNYQSNWEWFNECRSFNNVLIEQDSTLLYKSIKEIFCKVQEENPERFI